MPVCKRGRVKTDAPLPELNETVVLSCEMPRCHYVRELVAVAFRNDYDNKKRIMKKG
jgi:hypothetical protein